MFSSLKTSIVNFLQREDGPTAVEYAVMLALIIVVCIAAITALGTAGVLWRALLPAVGTQLGSDWVGGTDDATRKPDQRGNSLDLHSASDLRCDTGQRRGRHENCCEPNCGAGADCPGDPQAVSIRCLAIGAHLPNLRFCCAGNPLDWDILSVFAFPALY